MFKAQCMYRTTSCYLYGTLQSATQYTPVVLGVKETQRLFSSFGLCGRCVQCKVKGEFLYAIQVKIRLERVHHIAGTELYNGKEFKFKFHGADT